jgi:WD40 repeat protein
MPTYRVLAGRAHFSVATLSEAAAGRRLPTLAVTLAYVRACDGDAEEWEQRWRSLAAELAEAEAPARSADGQGRPQGDDGPPYCGLAAFQTADAHRFFGRARLVGELENRLAQRRFLAVFGASGAGKSSLLRAGLIPAWLQRRDDAAVLLFTPGPHPLRECAARLAGLVPAAPGSVHTDLPAQPGGLHRLIGLALTTRPADAELLLVVDQFEEVFTLCTDPVERAQFLSALVTAARAHNSRCRIVLGIRADFYQHCTAHPDLLEALNDSQVAVGPMSTGELRQAITEPAIRSGHAVEGALLATLVAEANGRVGVLPLLSHALLETWRRRRGNTLTLNGFQAAGGIDGALANTAERVYHELDERQQLVAKDLLLRLTALGEGTEDTKRCVNDDELDRCDPDTGLVLDRLTRARLLTVGRDGVEVTHESLIRCWPRLHDWLTEDREGLRIHRRLTEAARQWKALDGDAGALYRGTRLSVAAGWVAAGDRRLTAHEAEFLRASLAADAAEKALRRRRNRRLQRLVALLSIVSVVATVATGIAIRARQAALAQRDIATSQRVANVAASVRLTNPALAAQLSLAAYRLAATIEARSSVLSTFASPYATQLLGGDEVNAVGFSPDGSTLATGGRDRVVRLWDTSDPRHPRPSGTLIGHDSAVEAVVFGPGTVAAVGQDGTTRSWEPSGAESGRRPAEPGGPPRVVGAHRLATTGTDGLTRVKDLADPRWTVPPLRFAEAASQANGIALSPDGRVLATAHDDHQARLWEVAADGGLREFAVLSGHTDGVRGVAFSADGLTLASGGADATVRLWSLHDLREPRELAVLSGHTAAVNSVAFHPRTGALASASADHTVRLWHLPGPRLAGHDSSVYTVDFGPVPGMIATGGYDRTVRLWNVADPLRPAPIATLEGHTGPVNSVAYSHDGKILASGSNDRTVRLWSARGEPGATIAHPDSVEAIGFSPTENILASASHDGTIRLWRVAGQHSAVPLAELRGHAGSVGALAFRPDGQALASGGADRTVRLWDLADPGKPRSAGIRTGHGNTVKTVAYHPRHGLLASGDEDGTTRLWDLSPAADAGAIATLTGHTDGVKAARFSLDGRILATASSDKSIRLWGITEPRHPSEHAILTGHTKPVDALDFGPDGHTLASGGEDRLALLWETDVERMTTRICATTGEPMPPSSWHKHLAGVPYRPPCA